LRIARNAFCGISTFPTCFIRFFPSFCFSEDAPTRHGFAVSTSPKSVLARFASSARMGEVAELYEGEAA
jgi:hypothetical protein